MSHGGLACIVPVPMNAPDVTHSIQLELRLDGTALVGHAFVPGEDPREFSGWVGLVRVVEALINEPRSLSNPTS